MRTTWLASITKLAPLLYGALVIAGKIFAATPAVADLPQHPSFPCDKAHAAASCGPRVAHKAQNDGQVKWQRPRPVHTATSSSN